MSKPSTRSQRRRKRKSWRCSPRVPVARVSASLQPRWAPAVSGLVLKRTDRRVNVCPCLRGIYLDQPHPYLAATEPRGSVNHGAGAELRSLAVNSSIHVKSTIFFQHTPHGTSDRCRRRFNSRPRGDNHGRQWTLGRTPGAPAQGGTSERGQQYTADSRAAGATRRPGRHAVRLFNGELATPNR